MLFDVSDPPQRDAAEESRNIFTMEAADDERDPPPELRDDSEPLDLLAWELTALKMGCNLDKKKEENSFDRVRNARDNLLAEIEVRKRQKPRSFKVITDDEPTEAARPVDGGSEDNPIPATNSLEAASGITRKVWQPSKKVSPRTSRRPPLPPRARLPSPHTVKPKALVMETIESSYQQPDYSAGTPRESTDGRLSPKFNDYNKPIVVDREERLGKYEYGTPIARSSMEPMAYGQQRSTSSDVSIDSMVARQDYSEKIVSPCQHSSIVKSAYVLENTTEVGSSWPEELTVNSEMRAPVSHKPALGEHIDLSNIELDADEREHIDLTSQMDPDELEAEYDRLVNTNHEPESRGDRPGGGHSRSTPKRKPLDEIRKRSMVSDVDSTDDQDLPMEDRIEEADSPQVIHLEEADEEIEDVEEMEDVEEVEEDEDAEEDGSTTNKTEPPEPSLQNSLVGQEPPETCGQSISLNEVVSSQESEEDIEEDDGDEEESISTNERDLYIFVRNNAKCSKKTGKARVDYDLSSIERVVADYFGGRNRLTEEATDPGTSFKKNIFNKAGGCCIGLP